jgi:hypothetical protein
MTLDQYIALLPPYHSHQSRFVNTLAALLQPLVEAQEVLAQLSADFDLDTAVGVQLDMVGEWLGRSRWVEEPRIGVYFAMHDAADAPLRDGFDQGQWLGPFDPTSVIVAMPDDTYRSVLRLQAMANHWDGTLASIQNQFATVFPGVVVEDKGDTAGGLMSMDVLIPGIAISTLLLSVLEQDFPIKPGGVRVNIIESTVVTEPLFGFDIDGAALPIRGFDHGAWGLVIASL